jgi:hypothetical protein
VAPYARRLFHKMGIHEIEEISRIDDSGSQGYYQPTVSDG